jgi:hypothetical protein
MMGGGEREREIERERQTELLLSIEFLLLT